MRAVGIALASIVSVLPANAGAQDIEAGHRMAAMWCAKCHAVEARQTGPALDVAPPFTAIARMKSTTAVSLNVFLSTPHPPMPDFSLTRREIADVSAYILSLRPSPGKGT